MKIFPIIALLSMLLLVIGAFGDVEIIACCIIALNHDFIDFYQDMNKPSRSTRDTSK